LMYPKTILWLKVFICRNRNSKYLHSNCSTILI
jgi:hypothetical protein